MTKEYLDIVDENNNLTGEKRLRKEVHSSGLWHRTVHIYYFIKKDGEYYFLVHLRSKNKDINPNTWDTRFGGHLQTGETTEKALLAELEEEIGIKAKLKDFIKGDIKKRNKCPNNEFSYTFYYPGKEDISDLKFKDNEVQEVKWMSAKEIIKEANNDSKGWSTGLQEFENIYNLLIELKP